MADEGLHRNEWYPFQIAGKAYIWVRVNGRLEARSALQADGGFTPAALNRIADGK
jgi:hypothetical protein